MQQEGLRLPPVKLFREGVMQPDILSIILANIRVPEERIGDIKAQVAALTVGEKRLTALLDRYAAKDAFFKQVLDSQRNFAKVVVPYWTKINDLYSNTVLAHIMEAPLQYDFLARPAKLIEVSLPLQLPPKLADLPLLFESNERVQRLFNDGPRGRQPGEHFCALHELLVQHDVGSHDESMRNGCVCVKRVMCMVRVRGSSHFGKPSCGGYVAGPPQDR